MAPKASGRKAHALESHWTRIARTFSGNHDVVVDTSTMKCATDCTGTIYVPANADYIPADQQAILEGMLDHETFHVQSEREARAARARGESVTLPSEAMERAPDAKRRQLINVVADIADEATARAAYDGVAENLSTLFEFCEGRLQAAYAKGELSPWRQITCGAIARGLGHDSTWLPADVQAILDAMEPQIVAARTARTVEERLPLVEQMWETINRMAADPPPSPDKPNSGEGEGDKSDKGESNPSDSGEGDSSDSGEADGEDGSEGEGEADGADGEGEDSEGEGDSSDSGEADGADGEGEDSKDKPKGENPDSEGKAHKAGEATGDESGADSGDSDKGEGDIEPPDSDGSKGDSGPDIDGHGPGGGHDPRGNKSAKEALECDEEMSDLADVAREAITDAAKADAIGNRRHIPHPDALKADRVVTPVMYPNYKQAYAELLAEVRPAVSALRGRLLTILRTRKACRLNPDAEDGELDAGALHRLIGRAATDKRVFTQEIPGETLDVAVAILRDFSGSMRRKSTVERQSCIALAEALDQLGVKTEIISFQNDNGDIGALYPREYSAAEEARMEEMRSVYNRFEPYTFRVYKTFDESFRKVRTRLVEAEVGGNNSDAEAIMFAARRLAARPEKRKVLIVLSDGHPAAHGDPERLMQACIDNVQEVLRAGIECVGVGIMDDSVSGIYPDWCVVHELEQLPKALFGILRQYLVARRTVRKVADKSAAGA